MRNASVILCTLLVALFSRAALAQYRTTPECLNEQLTQDALMAALNNPGVADGTAEPPGQLSMLGPFGDPLYSDPAWEKREWTQYFKNTRMSSGYVISSQKFTVQLHYMWNRRTHTAAQIKFKTTVDQGCVGKKVSDATPADKTPISQMVNGYDKSYLGQTSYQRVYSGTVTPGPIVPLSTTFVGNWSGAGNGSLGNGTYGGFFEWDPQGGSCNRSTAICTREY